MLYKEIEIYTESGNEVVKEINQGRELLPVCIYKFHCHFPISTEDGLQRNTLEKASSEVFVKAHKEMPKACETGKERKEEGNSVFRARINRDR